VAGCLEHERPPARAGGHQRAALGDAEVARLARSQGLNPAPSSPQEFAAIIKVDYEKWKKVIGRS
jgi:tripartite-type tricarboxylate transporter receptor subunit TctC